MPAVRYPTSDTTSGEQKFCGKLARGIQAMRNLRWLLAQRSRSWGILIQE